MSEPHFTTTIAVAKSASEVFDAINDVRGWWSGNIEGAPGVLDAEWIYRFQDVHYSKHRTAVLVPGKRIVWRVVDGYLDFVSRNDEWIGTEIHFDLTEQDGETLIRFTHVGLRPQDECWDACSVAWSFYIHESLKKRIVTGRGDPNARE